MTTYVAMLRGINVSGQKIVRMDELKGLFEHLGCRDIRTYIQSGNVVCASGTASAGHLASSISEAVEAAFGFAVPVVVRTSGELGEIIKKNPFTGKQKDHTKLLVSFLSRAPETPIGETPLSTYSGPDEYHYVDRELYLHCPGGYGRTKLSNTYIEKTLGVVATTRNWKTVLTLARMAER